jgi:hypothetical protein
MYIGLHVKYRLFPSNFNEPSFTRSLRVNTGNVIQNKPRPLPATEHNFITH